MVQWVVTQADAFWETSRLLFPTEDSGVYRLVVQTYTLQTLANRIYSHVIQKRFNFDRYVVRIAIYIEFPEADDTCKHGFSNRTLKSTTRSMGLGLRDFDDIKSSLQRCD